MIACSIESGTIDELGPGSDAAAGDAPSVDGGPATDGASAHEDASTHPVDASCGTAVSAGSAIAFPSAKTKTIDGMDDDWGCEVPFHLDSTNAANKGSKDGGYDVSDLCKFEWTPGELYIYCDVTDPSPGEGVSTNPTLNDAVGIYVSGTAMGSRTGNYSGLDHQYAVDWSNQKAEFANTTQLVTPTSFTSAVRTHAGGYAVEASVDATVLGIDTSLAASMTLGFDLEIDDGAGQAETLLWAQSTHGPCGTCNGSCCCAGTTSTNSPNSPRR